VPDRKYFDQVWWISPAAIRVGWYGRGTTGTAPCHPGRTSLGCEVVVGGLPTRFLGSTCSSVEQEFGGCSKRRAALGASDLQLCSLRGLDLNQRPLGYESCISRSAQAYPLLTGHVRCSEITSDHLSQTHIRHKNCRPWATSPPGLLACRRCAGVRVRSARAGGESTSCSTRWAAGRGVPGRDDHHLAYRIGGIFE
jgi:hypothetical protein